MDILHEDLAKWSDSVAHRPFLHYLGPHSESQSRHLLICQDLGRPLLSQSIKANSGLVGTLNWPRPIPYSSFPFHYLIIESRVYEACPEIKDTKVLNMYNIFNLQKRQCEWISCT